jgi:hypothetical protein
MNLQTLEKEINDLVKRWEAANRAAAADLQASEQLIDHVAYTQADHAQLQAMVQERQQQIITGEVRPLIEKVISIYVEATPPDRETIRTMSGRPWSFAIALQQFAYECADQCQTPDDGNAFFRALLALSIENALDFRDTQLCLEHIRAAVTRAGINTTPYAVRAAALSSDERSALAPYSMKQWIERLFVVRQN